ncbi:MAG TPA: hypothetical protein VGN14_02585 [Candidatus Elarobacter sp.]
MRTFVIAAVFMTASVAPAVAQPAPRCSTESFPVGGQAVAVSVCAGTPDGKSVPVTESFKAAGGSFSHGTSVEVLPGAATSRTVDDVSLSPLGLNYTMHLTLAYAGGAARIEHALLLPGAIPLK